MLHYYGKYYGASSKRVKSRIMLWSRNSTSGYIYKRTESRISKSYFHIHVKSSLIHNSHEVKATKMFNK